jgi:Ca-activated chloride channel family protein
MFIPVVAVVAMLMVGCGSSGDSRQNSPAGRPGPLPTVGGGPGAAGSAGVDGSVADRSVAGGEVSAERQPLSTFAVDIDTASYGYARRQLTAGQRPDPASVRPEEFVNAFRQEYRQPDGNGFTVQVDGSRWPTTQGALRLMRVGLQTRAENAASRADAALTFVVDVSGSMSEPGKLDLVRDALATLVDQLRATDSVAIVAYDDKATVLREMTPVRDRAALQAAVKRLEPGGSTNLEDGLVTGYDVARRGFRDGATNRVILLSDGLANVGNTRAEPIVAKVREAAAKRIALLGVGVGSDYGDALMERLADTGDGFVVYVSTPTQAREVFVEQLPATLAVRALDAKVQVRFEPAVVASYRLVGYDNRALNPSAFRNDRVDGGEVGPGHSVTALYVVRLHADAAGGGGRVAEARIRWLDPVTREPTEQAATVSVGGLATGFEAAAPRLRLCYAAAYFAEVLRRSPHAGEVRLTDLAQIADEVAARTDDREITELATLIRRAARVSG